MPNRSDNGNNMKIGLLVPSSNTTMENDFYRELPDGYNLHVARMFIKNASKEEEEAMVDVYFPRALADIATVNPNAIVFGCTSASTIRGPKGEQNIEEQINQATKARVITVTNAIRDEINAIGAKKIVLISPYINELNIAVSKWLSSCGFNIVASKGMGILLNTDIADTKPNAIAEFALDFLIRNGLIKKELLGYSYDKSKVDMLLFSCTNFRAWEAIRYLESQLSLPMSSSNLATFRQTIRCLSIKG